MDFSITRSLEIIQRTPFVLDEMLKGISADWHLPNEGKETWSVFDVVGHLIHGEKTDWLPRAEIILSSNDKRFEPFNMHAHFEASKGKTLDQLLTEFRTLREANIRRFKEMNIKQEELENTGIHPEFGNVTLSQHLATWVVHDLNHIGQIARIMAKQYESEVGPWKAYLGILRK